MRWLDGITDSMDVSFTTRGLQEIRVATREDSRVLCFPSRRGLTPRGILAENSRGQRGSLPQTRRGLTLLSQLCRDPAVGVRNAEEA